MDGRSRRWLRTSAVVVIVAGAATGALAWSTSASFSSATGAPGRVSTLLPYDLSGDGIDDVALDIKVPTYPLPNQRCTMILPVSPVPQQIRAYSTGRHGGEQYIKVHLELGTTRQPYDCGGGVGWNRRNDVFNGPWTTFVDTYTSWDTGDIAGVDDRIGEALALRFTVTKNAGAPASYSTRIIVILEARPCGLGTPIPRC